MAQPLRAAGIGHALGAHARWLLRARPVDYLLAMSTAPASLPFVGRHFEPLGGLAALGVWGARYLPDGVSTVVGRCLAADAATVRNSHRTATPAVLAAALREVVPVDDAAMPWPRAERLAPVWKTRRYRKHVHRTSVRYGNSPCQVLDVWRINDLPAQPAPVLLFVPGGAWVFGKRELQGHALMAHLAELGWVCLSIEYRTAPRHRWPLQLTDIKSAIAWARANVDRFGGDRDFIALAGCSAGGHLAALAGLTPNDPEMQLDLPPGSDTSVDGVISIYGRYDWQDRSTRERARFIDFLERVVVQKRLSRHPDVFRKASPIARIRQDQNPPPFLVIHGSADMIIPVGEARAFVAELRSVSRAPVGYVELPGAGHAFDLTDGVRTGPVVGAIGSFLGHIHRHRRMARDRAAI
ncbi:alpha/beta hydrolase [Mycobacterium sp.]|uniref:alpha/beta hydrolase n=1 Tax=Mycobacterium sp. TaxID=1785 RepID=UPI002C3931FE|nr:alpha/beta hydrolase [Mycobacterium sp.]HME47662.1 alpha/beta hydrolase [Mycobacterium sp.]